MDSTHILKYALLILMFFFCAHANGQKLIESRQTSYYTYIYQLTDKEAETVYTSKVWEVNPTYFHTLIDSFPTDSVYNRRLPAGHYIKTYAAQNAQNIEIATVQDFNVFVLNNNTDLRVQVYDLEGKIISDAELKVKKKRLRFDKKTQCYIEKKSNRKGLLEIKHDGFTAYYNLSRNRNNSAFKRGFQKTVYGTPLKYVWRPVRFVVKIPVDGVLSIKQRRPRGSIYKIQKAYENIACRFGDWWYCGGFEDRHKGYMVFNKPKYLPGDTVKLKAFVVKKKGKPINKEVDVVLLANRKLTKLTRLKPYRKGGYTYEFVLHDSLQLSLDKNYGIYLQTKDGREYIHESFRYEDYELSSTQLAIRLDDKKQYKNQERTLYIKGTDENDLNILDGRVEVLVTPKSINEYFDNQVFVPDTLLFLEQSLDPVDETEIALPDSLFPKINFDYEVNVKLMTSDNEVKSDKKTITYYHQSRAFDAEVLTDSIRFLYTENGIEKPKKVKISSGDSFGNNTLIRSGTTPFVLELNPYYALYEIESDSLSETIRMNDKPSLLRCYANRTTDSVFIEVDNPRNIPFNYNIYKKNTEKYAGYSDSLNLKKKTATKQNYFVSINYLWAGKVVKENYEIPLKDKKLNVTVTEPKMVYPGEKTSIEVLVTDINGQAVENVDVTAYGLTKKFGETAPEVPDLAKQRRGKALINNFNVNEDIPGKNKKIDLDYERWTGLAGLDSIEYYRFIYPEKNSIYRFEYTTQDSVTQFSPFVVEDGAIQPIHVIYVDNKPVYFSWSTHQQPYSFKINPGLHQIRLRTTKQEIKLDSIYFNEGKRLIFSINEDIQSKNINLGKAKPELSVWERNVLHKYIFPYDHNFEDNYAYIEENGKIQVLNRGYDRYRGYGSRQDYAGPVTGMVDFHLLDKFSTTFGHEPFFEYDFAPNLLKMRSIDSKNYPKHLHRYDAQTSLGGEYLTKGTFLQEWEAELLQRKQAKAKYFYPKISSSKTGSLRIKLNRKPTDKIPQYILIFKQENNDLVAIYPGSTVLSTTLAKGDYKVIFFHEGEWYHTKKVTVNPYGLNYYEYKYVKILSKDNFSKELKNLINQILFGMETETLSQAEKDATQAIPLKEYKGDYKGRTITGYALDEEGNPLPFANIFVEGTTVGTTTDLDGRYTIKVPEGADDLVVAYTGYSDQKLQVGNSNVLNATLSAGEALDEVIVTALGFMPGRNLSYSTVETESISDVGVRVSGKALGISFRGARQGDQIIYVNGERFDGDISQLDPSKIKNTQSLKGSDAAALYGAEAANGVLLIQTISGANKGAAYDSVFFEKASKASSIRENFSDYAFWQPKLTTNKEGKATFELTFPDDVTSWETYYLAMNGKRQSGQTAGFVKSYKPLMAQVAVPRFLIENDTTYAIGKVLNYGQDSVKVNTTFELDEKIVYKNTEYCTHSIIDTLTVVAASDSLSLKYVVENQDGYFDGERRDIPVFPRGLEETEGQFYVLDNDTTINLTFNPQLGTVNLYARADVLDVIEDEIRHLIRYKYLCNEQVASKLKGLLAAKKIAQYKGEEFKYDKRVKKLIRLLKKNQKEKGLWGWWKDSAQSKWISLHVLEAVDQAKKMGYKVGIKVAKNFVWELEEGRTFYESVRLLKMSYLFEKQIDAPKYIANLEKTKDTLSFNHDLQILELKQLYKMDYDTDTIASFMQTTMFGNIYFEEKRKGKSRLLFNDIQNTILAYKILKSDSTNHDKTLAKMRHYFLEKRNNGYWRNTYESAQIIETILPDLLDKKTKLTQPTLTLSGNVNQAVSEFPFEMQVQPNQQISVSKSGDFPIYFTNYQRYQNRTPEIKKDDFEVTTKFENQPSRDAINRVSTNNVNRIFTLEAGEKTTLIVEVTVKKDADYVMINVPIPGGCSYSDKQKNYRSSESHREYFKHETAIFCQNLPKGKYTYEINLIPRYSGNYTLNPAKVELMYFPVFSANNEVKKVQIK